LLQKQKLVIILLLLSSYIFFFMLFYFVKKQKRKYKMNPLVIVIVLVVLLIGIGVGVYFYVSSKNSASPLKEGPVSTPYVPKPAPAPTPTPPPTDVAYNNPTTFNPNTGPADIAPVAPPASGPGGNCPCDPTLAWCGPDNKCYETCYTRGSCAGNLVPRINTYSCDYSRC